MSISWHKHLCEYYKVTPEEALQLGTRSSGRKPNLPGSETCKEVSGMTYEDIWALSKRETVEDVFKFYKDQGAWSTFRQCVRHIELEQLHLSLLNSMSQAGGIFNNSHFCEYGAGVAPFATTLLKNLPSKDVNLTISIVDVDCEHLNFAKYRLNSIVKELDLKNINLEFYTVEPESLPTFTKKIDALICFEVLEHVPSPVEVIKNISKSMRPGSIYVENFIKHEVEEDEDSGPDLLSARNERSKYYDHVESMFNLIFPDVSYSNENPNCTRVWQRNSI